MKKKQVSLSKKLTLGKSTVGALNVSQQELIAGGIPTTTVTFTRINCPTFLDTCATIPPGAQLCQFCATL
ncbi:class I lanthipeptide [Chitinophaga sp. HK235]|uniref:class I lanthipeptide n=1 Tax=Chitinophaga sp. HK235 TaxID=2952571 RepID=UPI001BA915E1|nr:class I lanthipeptide [Chitinophaga sp. HK235]